MTLGKLINFLQQIEVELGSEAEAVVLQGNWWDCRSSDMVWPSVLEVVPIPSFYGSLPQAGISFTPEPPSADIMTWERMEQNKESEKKSMKDRYDIERVECEERLTPALFSSLHGPVVRFRVLKNGFPLPWIFDSFEEAEEQIKSESS